ncbi:non-specific lipid transfer protein GPI-anchored 20-like [Phragmites australis]|uniref:non-specific lipid transfer protein GPI-anchored 20-like n=1 Tax=Phragmites australis TaxID=29695 RepID=UPI002D76896A|nr:non-specific lipid transfer protein GPI-anchored 20-like [Phragmites australis]
MRRDRTVGAAAAPALMVLLLAALGAAPASGQVATSCAASLVTTFTPCLNFVTGSTNGGGSPTQQCCGSLAEMVRTSADCACLVLTGNVPFSLPINRTLAISLPKFCNSMSVPLQCRDTATQIPAPGPVAFAPALPPLPPIPPESSVQPDSPVDPTAMSPAVESPPITQRPVVVPSSAWRSSHLSMVAVAMVLSIAASIFI